MHKHVASWSFIIKDANSMPKHEAGSVIVWRDIWDWYVAEHIQNFIKKQKGKWEKIGDQIVETHEKTHPSLLLWDSDFPAET